MKKIKKYLLIAVTGCISFSGAAQVNVLFEKLNFPESVTSDGQFLYVSEIGNGSDFAIKDGNGRIKKLSLKGELIMENISKEPLHTPTGNGIAGDVLYVADIDRIVGISLQNGEAVRIIDLSAFGTHMLNGLSIKDDNELFVSASDLNKIFSITLADHPVIEKLNIPDVVGANGLCYDKNTKRLYVAGLGTFNSEKGIGKLGYIEWRNGAPAYTEIPNCQGFFDGITLTNEGEIIVSDWVHLAKPIGVILKINPKTGQSAILSDSKMGGPANFYFDRRNKIFFIPEAMTGKLLLFPLK